MHLSVGRAKAQVRLLAGREPARSLLWPAGRRRARDAFTLCRLLHCLAVCVVAQVEAMQYTLAFMRSIPLKQRQLLCGMVALGSMQVRRACVGCASGGTPRWGPERSYRACQTSRSAKARARLAPPLSLVLASRQASCRCQAGPCESVFLPRLPRASATAPTARPCQCASRRADCKRRVAAAPVVGCCRRWWASAACWWGRWCCPRRPRCPLCLWCSRPWCWAWGYRCAVATWMPGVWAGCLWCSRPWCWAWGYRCAVATWMPGVWAGCLWCSRPWCWAWGYRCAAVA